MKTDFFLIIEVLIDMEIAHKHIASVYNENLFRQP